MANIVIIGAGFVGTATGTVLKDHGNNVMYVDTDPDKRQLIARTGEKVFHPDELDLDIVNFVFISVPTPTTENGIVCTYLEAAAKSTGIALRKRNGTGRPIVVFRSTMLPGTTKRLITILEQYSGGINGTNFAVAYMPEYLRERSAITDFKRPKIILIGCDEHDMQIRNRLEVLFKKFESSIYFTSYEAAEFQKYVHNALNAVKISYFNEMRLISKSFNIDEKQVEQMFCLTTLTAEALWRPDYGVKNLGPYGGNCLPKDVLALLTRLRQSGVEAPLLEGAHKTNQHTKLQL